MRTFSAQVSAAIAKYEKRLNAVFTKSAEELVEEVLRPVDQGGRMRVDTGFLRSSLQASTSTMPMIMADARPGDGQTYQPDDGAIAAVILGAQIGQTLYFGFTAAYARPREYHDAFVRGAAQQWEAIVRRNSGRALIAFP